MARSACARVIFRPLAPEDWPAVAEIYRQGIESGNATFETEVPTWASWDAARSPESAAGFAFSGPRSVWAVFVTVAGGMSC